MRTPLSRLAFIAVSLAALVALAGCSSKARTQRYTQRADEYFAKEKYDEARLEYLNVLRIDQANGHAIQRMGESWLISGDALEALRYLVTACDLAPDDMGLAVKKATATFAVGHRADARKEALAIWNKAPSQEECLQVLADTASNKSEVEETQKLIAAVPPPDRATLHLASATLLLKIGDVDGAQKQLDQALTLDAKSSLAHVGKGTIAWQRGDLAAARSELQKAAELSSLRGVGRMRSADFLLQTGELPAARAALQEITTKAPDFLPAWVTMGRVAIQERKWDEALSTLNKALTRDPEYFDARIFQASVWAAQGQFAKAEESLEALDRRHPAVAPLKVQLAKVYLQDNKLNQAGLVLDAVVSGNPNYVEAILLQASVTLRRGDAQAAAAALENLLRRHPDLVQPQMVLAEAYRYLSRFDEAAAILKKQVAASPDDAPSHFLLGLIYQQEKNGAESRAEFEKANQLAPHNVLYLTSLVDLDIAEKKFDAARARVSAEEQQGPLKAPMHALLGKIAAAEGKWADAEKLLLKALEIDPAYTPARELLISTYAALKDPARSLREINQLLAQNPSNQGALKTAALLSEKTGEYEKARDFYERYLALKPDDQPMVNNLAYLYCEKLHDLNRAMELARQARSLSPADPGAADTLGWIMVKQGEYAQGLALLAEAAQKLGELPEVQFHLGTACYMMGRLPEAREALSKAAAAKTDFDGRAEAQERLAILEAAGAKDTPSTSLVPLVQKYPKDLLLHQRLGEAYIREGKATEAAAEFVAVTQQNPKLVSPLLALTKLYAGQLKDAAKAVDYGKRAKQLAPDEPAVSAALGKAILLTGDFPRAYAQLQDATRQLKDQPDLLLDLAFAAVAVGKMPEAEAALRKISEVSPGAPEASKAEKTLKLLTIARDPKSVPDAGDQVSKAIAEEPENTSALLASAALEREAGRAKESGALYEKILQTNPECGPALKGMALLNFDDPARRAKVKEWVAKARASVGDDPDLQALQGALSFEGKEYSYAIQLLEESGRKKPLTARWRYYLGRSYLASNQKSKAAETLRQALEAGLGPELEPAAREALATAEK